MGFGSLPGLGGGHGSDSYTDWNKSGIAGPVNQALAGSEFGNMVLDPMDLFGGRARGAREEIQRILMQSALEGIAQQEEQETYLRDRYEPYYQAAVGEGGALEQLSSMAMGGDVDYTPSRLYEYQKKEGLEGISEGAAKAGLLHSSATMGKKADFMGDLAAEESERMYGGQLSRLQMGAGAADAVTAAGSSVSGNIGSLYSNLAGGLNATQQAYGQARRAAFESAGNTLGNLSAYQAQQR